MRMDIETIEIPYKFLALQQPDTREILERKFDESKYVGILGQIEF